MRTTKGNDRDCCCCCHHDSSRSNDNNGKEHNHKTKDDVHHHHRLVVGRRRNVRFVGLRGNVSLFFHVLLLLSVAAVTWSAPTVASGTTTTTTTSSTLTPLREATRDRHLRQRRRAHSEDQGGDQNDEDDDDDLTDMDLRMCMDMIQVPSSSSSTTSADGAAPFASQQVDQLVDHLNNMTQGRFGTYQELTPPLRHHLWLYAKHQLYDHRTQRPPRDDGMVAPTPSLSSSSSSTSTSTASSSLTYLRPICAHMVHSAQVMTIPFQFILQERSSVSTDSTTFTSSFPTNNYPPKQRNQQPPPHESWISKWQSLAPTLVQTQGFQCQDVSSSSSTTTITTSSTGEERHADNNLFLRHHQPPPQQQAADTTSSSSSPPTPTTECPYLVRVNVRNVIYHVGCLLDADETVVTNQKCHLITSTAVITMSTTTNSQSTTTWTNLERDHVRRVTVAALAKSLQSSRLDPLSV